jgi:uncharacterized membrane protein YhaH (DUF805 family)
MARLTEVPARSRFSSIIHLLFGYEGRIGRLYYWLGLMAAWAITGLFAAFAEDATAGTGDIGRYVAFVVIVGTLVWIHSAVTVKRLHDRGRSAWWYALYGLAPPALFVAATYFYTKNVLELASILFVLSIAGLIWVIVELGVLPGPAHPNRYGPPA